MNIYNRIRSVWEKIKKQGETEDQPAENPDVPSADLPPYRHRAGHHHPNAYEVQHRTAEREYWQDQLRLAKDLNVITKALNTITISTAVIAGFATLAGFISLGFLKGTLDATKDAAEAAATQARIALTQLHSQRPFMALGRGDGVIVEYRPPTETGRKGTIQLYFSNTGPAPALRFLVGAHSSLPTAQIEKGRHLYRRRVIQNGKPTGWLSMGGHIVAANAPYVVTLDSTSVPSDDEWRLIETGKLEFIIRGTYEYCDSWGKYTCNMFMFIHPGTPGKSLKLVADDSCVPAVLKDTPPPFLWPPETEPPELQVDRRCQQPEERAAGDQELDEFPPKENPQ